LLRFSSFQCHKIWGNGEKSFAADVSKMPSTSLPHAPMLLMVTYCDDCVQWRRREAAVQRRPLTSISAIFSVESVPSCMTNFFVSCLYIVTTEYVRARSWALSEKTERLLPYLQNLPRFLNRTSHWVTWIFQIRVSLAASKTNTLPILLLP
jgi:hypothetical protein